ncbi:MAG: four helix bundle protein [Desulfobacteraceae bacterium]|nr:MAG: four helix bundle protein [Desulfobacteraceae bacterium]
MENGKGKSEDCTSLLPLTPSRPAPSLLSRPHFRFEDLEIWQRARDLAVRFHQLSDKLEKRRLFRYAEQLRAAGLSISNNIAEGSGSLHRAEFLQFLGSIRISQTNFELFLLP